MAEDKSAKRRRRLMRLLEKGEGVLHATADPSTFLLEFPGERSVRCPVSDLNELLHRGLLSVEQVGGYRKVALSTDGAAALRRGENGDYAGQHRQMRVGTVVLNGQPEKVPINDSESPLSSLARMRRPDGLPWLGKEEVAAGERLRMDFERALLQPRITSSWDFSHVSGTGKPGGATEIADSAIAARDRVNAAMDAVGPDLGGALVDICCFLKGMEQVERERGWPRRSAKLMLKTALAMLDRHYHPQTATRNRRRGVLHWGADGYRPAIRAG